MELGITMINAKSEMIVMIVIDIYNDLHSTIIKEEIETLVCQGRLWESSCLDSDRTAPAMGPALEKFH